MAAFAAGAIVAGKMIFRELRCGPTRNGKVSCD